MCRSRGESASEWIFSSFRKGSRKWGGAQNWTLAKSFLFCVLSLALAKPWDCLKIILNPFQFTSVFSHYFLLPLHIHNADIWPSSSHARSLHLPARLFPRRVFLLMCTSSLSWHSKVLSTITISYLVSLLYIFFFFQIMPLLFSPLSTWLCLYPWLSSRCFHLLFAYPNTVISWSLPSLPNLAPWGTLFYFIFPDHLMLQSLMYWVK